MSRYARKADPVEELAAAFVRTSFSPSPGSAPLDGFRPHKMARPAKSSYTMTPQESELDTSDEELRLLSTMPALAPIIMPTITEERPHEVFDDQLAEDDDLLGTSEDSSETSRTWPGQRRLLLSPSPSSAERTTYSYRRRLKRTCADLFEGQQPSKSISPKILSPNSFVGYVPTASDRNSDSSSRAHPPSRNNSAHKHNHKSSENKRRHSVSTSPLFERTDERSLSPTDQSHRRRFETEPSRDTRDR